MALIYTQEDLLFLEPHIMEPPGYKPSIFLAGPTPRATHPSERVIPTATPSWRPAAIDHIRSARFSGSILIPEPRDGVWTNHYDYQVEWEKKAMELADVILFWVPRRFDRHEWMPGLTTNIEWGFWTAKNPAKLVLGYPVWAEKIAYLAHDALRLSIPFHHDLKWVCEYAADRAAKSVR